MKLSYLFFVALVGTTACTQSPSSTTSPSPEKTAFISQTADALLLLPDMPHERTKNRELSLLVELLIQTGDLKTAEVYQQKISNWRKNQLKADIATAYFKAGDTARAEKLIAEVVLVAETIEGIKAGRIVATGENKNVLEAYDDFRLDRVKVALSEYYWIKGDKDAAKRWSENVLPAEQAEFIRMQAEMMAEKDYQGALDINLLLAQGETFEGKKVAIDGLTQLYSLYFEDEEKRQELTEYFDTFSVTMPLMFRIDWLQRMAVTAFEHGDAELAEQFYHEASTMISDSELKPRMFFSLKASNIMTAHQLDHGDDALEAAEILYGKFDEFQGSIFDIHRADVLCSVGEAFAFIGQLERAQEVYLNALSQAGINPNSRPRVEDLNLLTVSVVEHDVPLTPAMEEKVDELVGALGEPW